MMLEEATANLQAAEEAFALLATRDIEDPDREAAEQAFDASKKSFAWATRSQSRPAISAMLEIATADASVAISHEQLDTDPLLLNCANGTIDLRTGELGPHQRAQLLTMASPVAYDPDATCPLWDAFVDQAMGGSGQMVAYLQRVVGYLLTGSVKEHALFFFYGGGANGKSTFTNTLIAMLGSDFAGPSPRDFLFLSKGEHPTATADLYRKRLVLCSEIGEGKRLDEALVKDITGGDAVKARRMREDFWTFLPTHKIVISGNHKPSISGTDDGIWRRLRLVPWLVTIPAEKRDRDLGAKLLLELPGILAWAVRGCIEWQRVGLADPTLVQASTNEYRDASDTLAEFFELLEFGPDVTEFRTSKARLRSAYEAWCEGEGHMPLGAKRLADRLRQHAAELGTTLGERMAVTPEAMYPVRAWFGVRVRTR